MKSLLIAIKPKWCAKIMNGNKTIEVRKNKALASAIQKLIDKYGYADIYVYCSKNGVDINGMPTELVDYRGCAIYNQFQLMPKGSKATSDDEQPRLNGKVIFKFRCYKVEEIKYHFGYYDMGEWAESYILENSCLSAEELDNYLQASKEYDETKVSRVYGYAIHISNLEIFDKPKELSEFGCYKTVSHYDYNKDCLVEEKSLLPLTKAPQNMVYIEDELL